MKKSRLKFFILPATLCLIDLMGYILYNGGRKEKQGMAKFIKEPELTVKEGKKNTYGHAVEIHGPSEIIYGGNDKPILSCGARVVIKTEAEITIK